MIETLHTERLVLRPAAPADARRLGPLMRDPGVARMLSGLPLMQPDIGTEGFLLIHQARAPLKQGGVLAIDLPGEGAIGLCGVEGQPDGGGEVSYWIGRPYWGRGFATEAAQALARMAGQALRGPLRGGHFIDNPASGRVLEKAGFVYTGEVVERYSLARRERAALRLMQLGDVRHAGLGSEGAHDRHAGRRLRALPHRDAGEQPPEGLEVAACGERHAENAHRAGATP